MYIAIATDNKKYRNHIIGSFSGQFNETYIIRKKGIKIVLVPGIPI